MADKTANIEYLCVIRENNGKTTFETIDIPVSTDLVTKLEGLTKMLRLPFWICRHR